MKIFISVTAAILLSWCPLITGAFLLQADETTPQEQRAQELQDFYNSLTSLTFDFRQISRVGARERLGSGNAVFVKPEIPEKNPSVMRWNYTEPGTQVIINNGTTLTIYTDKDRQLIRTSARELESDITYAFFAGNRDLLEDFAALPADNGFVFSTAEELQAVKLVPRQPHNQIRAVTIWSDDNKIIRHMVIEDHFDAVTELTFEQVSINSIRADDMETIDGIISFDVPPGTEIITQ
ncbi:MAG: outer membrane lipoprotein carrier protein LolA [Desulfobulbaceae bacterium]|nr:outer membrane lipoprotein carrier protein LolA [Desulfobulbaceae bacterium]